MRIQKLTVLNFKNYDDAVFNFSDALNLITGLNGSGKTNLLDAIHYISLTKSAFNVQDQQNIQAGKSYFSIQANIQTNQSSHQVLCNFVKGDKKQIIVDKSPYSRVSEYIGRFPSILITPYDTDLVREGSAERRRFFDTMISQIDQKFLHNLISYNHVLKQRNAALKQFNASNTIDKDLLEYYDGQLLAIGKEIYEVRKEFIMLFSPIFQKYYQFISTQRDSVSLEYQTQLDDPEFVKLFGAALERDVILQRTTKGVHKDDFLFHLDGSPLKTFGSQGQQKSFVIALKIAQYEVIKEKKGFFPVLLLDDIFDKLDDERIHKLLEMISSGLFGQIFITDASLERVEKYTAGISAEIAIFKIHNGTRING